MVRMPVDYRSSVSIENAIVLFRVSEQFSFPQRLMVVIVIRRLKRHGVGDDKTFINVTYEISHFDFSPPRLENIYDQAPFLSRNKDEQFLILHLKNV